MHTINKLPGRVDAGTYGHIKTSDGSYERSGKVAAGQYNREPSPSSTIKIEKFSAALAFAPKSATMGKISELFPSALRCVSLDKSHVS
jgi:hypothetical protein